MGENSCCDLCWKSCFFKIYGIKDIKLKWLQIINVHRILATNVVLKKMDIINFEQCALCDKKDSIEHFLWQCYYITRCFWQVLENAISEYCETVCNLQLQKPLFCLV